MFFIMELWYSLGKLRLHTETTLDLMDGVTTLMGKAVRKFKRAVDVIETRELQREADSRKRREISRAAKEGRAPKEILPRKAKKFNLERFKWHSAGHVVGDIREFGPTEIYSTQWVRVQCVVMGTD